MVLEKVYYAVTKRYLKHPLYLIYFITNKCNSRCIHCFNWKNLNKPDNELNLKEIDEFTHQMGKLVSVNFSGGEPFLRDDLVEVFEIFKRNSMPDSFGISTNGLCPELIAEKFSEILKRKGKMRTELYLSLDGTRGIHDRIRGVKGSFDKLIETYQAIEPLRNQYDFLISIETTLCNMNIDDLGKLEMAITEYMPDIDFHGFEIMRGTPPDQTVKPPTIEQLKRIIPFISRIWKKYTFYGSKSKWASQLAYYTKLYMWEAYIKIISERKQIFPCYAPLTSCVVDNVGNVYFCELLESIGNLRQKKFNEIWRSEPANLMRKYVKEKRCYCVHSCFQPKNVFLNLKLYPDVLSSMIHKMVKGLN